MYFLVDVGRMHFLPAGWKKDAFSAYSMGAFIAYLM